MTSPYPKHFVGQVHLTNRPLIDVDVYHQRTEKRHPRSGYWPIALLVDQC